jgi:hypothetical protein
VAINRETIHRQTHHVAVGLIHSASRIHAITHRDVMPEAGRDLRLFSPASLNSFCFCPLDQRNHSFEQTKTPFHAKSKQQHTYKSSRYSDKFSLVLKRFSNKTRPKETQENSSLCQSKISRPSVSPCLLQTQSRCYSGDFDGRFCLEQAARIDLPGSPLLVILPSYRDPRGHAS